MPTQPPHRSDRRTRSAASRWTRKSVMLTTFVAGFSLCIPLVFAQFFSPGKLSKVHSHLSGLRNCKKCHIGGRDINNKSCLSCHKELTKQVNAGRGFHGRMSRSKLYPCKRCHTEHKGRNFKIVYWKGGQRNFKHMLTGYRLHHKHGQVDCRKCHTSKHIRPTARRYFAKWGRTNKTFLGLPQTCKSCHQDPHRGQVSKDCQRCHSEKGWQKAHRFSHASTRFPLHNKHRKVACTACHKPLPGGKKGALRFKVTRSCKGCHTDPHAGKMTTGCERCHSDIGWTTVAFAKSTHAPDRFKLDGAHVRVNCKACHGPKLDKSINVSCKSCHKTPHSPSFSTNCVKCHNTRSWQNSKFSRAAHDKTRFPLHGMHEKVACNKCHKTAKTAKKRRKKRRFRMKLAEFSDCSPCHKDVHQKQFKNTCKSCHSEAHFTPSKFGVQAHAKTKFPLKHAHLAVPCAGCHKQDTASKDPLIRYKPLKHTCQSCHKSPHKTMYDSVIKDRGCQGCHSQKSWSDVNFRYFRHDMTSFALTGKHGQVKCSKCHAWKRRSSGRVLPQYKLGTNACRDCHTDAHIGQFDKGNAKARCETCHTTKAWKKASRFDHQKARFKLTGAHKKVKCNKCHKPHTLPNQQQTTLYRPIKHDRCIHCHNNYHERKRK